LRHLRRQPEPHAHGAHSYYKSFYCAYAGQRDGRSVWVTHCRAHVAARRRSRRNSFAVERPDRACHSDSDAEADDHAIEFPRADHQDSHARDCCAKFCCAHATPLAKAPLYEDPGRGASAQPASEFHFNFRSRADRRASSPTEFHCCGGHACADEGADGGGH
jgi:hypothetical protein